MSGRVTENILFHFHSVAEPPESPGTLGWPCRVAWLVRTGVNQDAQTGGDAFERAGALQHTGTISEASQIRFSATRTSVFHVSVIGAVRDGLDVEVEGVVTNPSVSCYLPSPLLPDAPQALPIGAVQPCSLSTRHVRRHLRSHRLDLDLSPLPRTVRRRSPLPSVQGLLYLRSHNLLLSHLLLAMHTPLPGRRRTLPHMSRKRTGSPVKEKRRSTRAYGHVCRRAAGRAE